MRLDARGLTTLECLVALVVFCVGILGAAGTTGLALRSGAEGTRTASVARLAAATFDRLRWQVRAPHGACLAATPGQATGDHGVSVTWDFIPVPAGRVVRLILFHPALLAPRSDTAWGFIGCH